MTYITLREPQPTSSGSRIELIEFFSYMCPSSNELEPAIEQWTKNQAANIAFKRVPLGLMANWIPSQKIYYALDAIGKLDILHSKIFAAVHVERKLLTSDDAVIEFAAKNGVNNQTVLDAYNSRNVQMRLAAAKRLEQAYKVEQCPMIAIGGRYMTSSAMAAKTISGTITAGAVQDATIKILDELIAKAKAR